jgi:energy-coupling factor transporter transmembrane protein EcfT
MGGFILLMFFATSTPIPYFSSTLRGLHVPKDLVELITLMYRYVFIILEKAISMRIAATTRLGFSGLKNSFRTFGLLAANLFIASFEFAERSQNGLKSRNFDDAFPNFLEFKTFSFKWILTALLIAACLLLFEKFFIAGSLPLWL